MRFLTCTAMAAALMAVSTRAAADPNSVPPPGTFKPARKGQEPPKLMTPAANIEGSMPDNISLTVGEKRSCTTDESTAQAGETNISLIGKAGHAPKAGDFKQQPSLIKVKVRD